VVDSAVYYFKDKWHLVAPTQKDAGQEGTYYYATSTDGLTFSNPTVIDTVSGDEWTGNLVEVNGKLRFYGSGKNVFYSELSDNGTWGTPVSTNAKGGDPSVVQAVESKYILFYTGMATNSTAPKQPAQ
jgi:hypothetical protein